MGASPLTPNGRRRAAPGSSTSKAREADSASMTPSPGGQSTAPCIFLSHRQGPWGDACSSVCSDLQARGCAVWFDMNCEDELKKKTMRDGVISCSVYALFLSPDLIDPLVNHAVLMELNTAAKFAKPIVPIYDRSGLHPKRYVKDPQTLLKSLIEICEFKPAFGQPVEYVQRKGPKRDAMLSEIYSRGGHGELAQVSIVDKDPISPELLVLGHKDSDVCDLLVTSFCDRGLAASLWSKRLEGSSSVKGFVIFVTKGSASLLVPEIQKAKASGKRLAFVYEQDARREGAFTDLKEAFQEFEKHGMDVKEHEFSPFGQQTRRGETLDAILRMVSRIILGTISLHVPFDAKRLPMLLSSRYETDTREWFFKDASSKVNQPVTMVVDTAGFGKSVLLAEFARRGGMFLSGKGGNVAPVSADFQVVGMHFFDSSSSESASASACIGSITVQLCSKIPGFRAALPMNLDKFLKLPVDRLFALFISGPLQAISFSPSVPLWIVIDGLDECCEPEELLHAIKHNSAPSWLHFLVSMRSTLSGGDIRLAPHQKEDMGRYLDRRLETSWKVSAAKDRAAIVEKLWQLSEGSFLWISYQEQQFATLSSNKALAREALDNLPHGLGAVYGEYFASFNKALGKELYLKVVGISIMTPRAPLLESLLVKVLKIKDYQQKVRAPAGKLLIFEADEQGVKKVRPPHKSMRDFLQDGFASSLEVFHGELARVLSDKIQQAMSGKSIDLFSFPFIQPEDDEVMYATKHFVYHSIMADDFDAARPWVLEFDRLLFWVNCAGPDLVLADIELLLAKAGLTADVAFASSVVRLGAHALRRDARELAGQVLGRASESENTHPLVVGAKSWLKKATQARGKKVLVPSQFSGLRNGNGLVNLIHDTDSVCGVAAVGSLILSCSNNKTARVHSDMGKRLVREFRGHTEQVMCGTLCASPDGTNWAITGSDDSTAQRWQAISEIEIPTEERKAIVLRGHSQAVYSVFVDKSTQNIITGSCDNTARIWKWSGGEAIAILSGHTQYVYGVHLQGTRAITGADAIRIWEGSTCIKTVQTSKSMVYCMSVTSSLIYAGYENVIDRIRIEDGEKLDPLDNGANICAIDAKEGLVVTGSEDNAIRVWDLDNSDAHPFVIQGHSNWVSAVRFTPDEKCIVSGSWDHTVCMWMTPRSSPSKMTVRHTDAIACMHVAGNFVATGGLDKKLMIWSLKTGEHVSKFDVPFRPQRITWGKGSIRVVRKDENDREVSHDVAFSESEPSKESMTNAACDGFHVLEPTETTVGFTVDDDGGCVTIGKLYVGYSGNSFRVWTWFA